MLGGEAEDIVALDIVIQVVLAARVNEGTDIVDAEKELSSGGYVVLEQGLIDAGSRVVVFTSTLTYSHLEKTYRRGRELSTEFKGGVYRWAYFAGRTHFVVTVYYFISL